jgi:hypothetical protein
MSVTFEDLIKTYVAGETSGRTGGGGNLKIQGDLLIHFNTTIAQRYNGKYLLNITRYSVITGRLQKILKNTLPSDRTIDVKKVPKNHSGSLEYFIHTSE